MFKKENIKWVKSVKPIGGSEWAYNELICDDTKLQKLHWRNNGGQTAAKHAEVGDIILLFQTLSYGPYRNIVRLTHLVSPVSSDVLIDPKNKDFKWYREVKAIAKAEPIHIIPKPDVLKFGKVGNGGLTFTIDLLANEKIGTAELQNLIWNLFEDFFCPNVKDNGVLNSTLVEFAGAKEGDTKIIMHLEQELRYRNTDIIREKKAQALQQGNGRIKCDCCKFDFLEIYGDVGEGFIECHHEIFLHQGERITKLEDLALVCSNCHRMLHRKKADNTYYSVEELRRIAIRGDR